MTNAPRSIWARLRSALLVAPWAIRLPLAYVEAVDEVLRNDFSAAGKRLLRLLSAAPEAMLDRVPVKLILARALLETGNPAAAAALFPEAFRPLQYPRRLLSDAERSFLKFMGNEIYERATLQLGRPSSFEIEVRHEDIDLTKVGVRLQRAFPYVQRNRSKRRAANIH